MPELPEVETVRRGLEPVLLHARVAQVEARRPNLRFDLPERFADRVKGATVTRLDRRAKYILAGLDSGETLLMHLGMTGRFTIQDSEGCETLGQYVYQHGGDTLHDHVVFTLSSGARVIYNDARRFGFMVLIPTAELNQHPLLAALGPEPLAETFTPVELANRAVGKKTNLKAFLMDQRVVAGLGNIYASEALFRARLSPDRGAATLAAKGGSPHPRAAALVSAIKDVLNDAIAAGGSTLRDYRHADGSRGGFQEKFFVYDRDGGRCMREGCGGVLRRKVHAGRATFYCPKCQR